MRRITAYTHRYDKVVDKILVNCTVSIPDDTEYTASLNALWDTGANITCISTRIISKLGLSAVDKVLISVANNETYEAQSYYVSLQMGAFIIPFIKVLGLPMDESKDMIIGMDVIARGDLSITNYSGRTILSFREPSLQTIDYVEELKLQDKCDKMHRINESKKMPDKCACGSGKDYKNCHGKSIYAKVTL